MKRLIVLPLVVFLETFILHLLIIIPAEYLLTEKFLIGPTWARGEVYVDDVPLIIENWSEEEVIAKLPVPPRHFQGRLFIIAANGEKSNSYPFEIRNPDFLKEKH